MGLSLLVLIGVFSIMLFMLFRNPFLHRVGKNAFLVKQFEKMKWFQNHWYSGIFLFVMNATLFFLTGLVLYVFMTLSIPYIHLFVMIFAVIVSIYLWMVINQAWEGEKRNRLKMGTVGSSFFIILTSIFFYQLATLEPAFPGDDPFMRAVGLVFGMIVTSVAFITCFIMTGFSKKKIIN